MNKIKFVTYKVVQTIFNPSEIVLNKLENMSSSSFDESSDFKDSLSYTPIYPVDDKNTFFVIFELDVTDYKKSDDDNTGVFFVKFIAQFECQEEIEQEFKDSGFPIINAPAIAYPFLRAFVHNFFLNAGYNTILLPTYNFVKAKKVHNEEGIEK